MDNGEQFQRIVIQENPQANANQSEKGRTGQPQEKRKSKLSRAYNRERYGSQATENESTSAQNEKNNAQKETSQPDNNNQEDISAQDVGAFENLEPSEEEEIVVDETIFIHRDGYTCQNCGEGFERPSLLRKHKNCQNQCCKINSPEHDHQGLTIRVPFLEKENAENYLRRKFPQANYRYRSPNNNLVLPGNRTRRGLVLST